MWVDVRGFFLVFFLEMSVEERQRGGGAERRWEIFWRKPRRKPLPHISAFFNCVLATGEEVFNLTKSNDLLEKCIPTEII